MREDNFIKSTSLEEKLIEVINKMRLVYSHHINENEQLKQEIVRLDKLINKSNGHKK